MPMWKQDEINVPIALSAFRDTSVSVCSLSVTIRWNRSFCARGKEGKEGKEGRILMTYPRVFTVGHDTLGPFVLCMGQGG